MTDEQIALALRLESCRFLPGSFDKRFCRSMANRARYAPESELNPKQEKCLVEMGHRYRRQLEGLPEVPDQRWSAGGSHA